MAENSRVGNVILAPGYNKGDEVRPVEILYSTVGLLQKGVTLEDTGGVLEAGTPLEYNAATKKYRAATATGNIRGFLRLAVDTTGHTKMGNIVYGGVLNTAAISIAGVMEGAGAATWANVATALGGTYDAERGFLKF